jgi:TolB-like protein
LPLETGQMLLHYRMVEQIGQGGMGVVWKAVDTTLDRDVAIKILPDEFAADTMRLARFEREAKILASLNHPEIASIYSLHEAEGLRFLAMEIVEGEVLTRRIPKDGMSLDDLLAIVIPLSDAVALAHQRGITHRDLKPDNVMITADGRVKVLDFGLAKLADRSSLDGHTQAATATAAAVTGEGKIVGSAAYMSPEQVESKTVGPGSDVFSLGIMLYEMATGTRPFGGSTPISILSAILRDTPSPVTSIRRALPPKLDTIISSCLEKDPQRRFRDAGELRDELRQLQREAGAGIPAGRKWRITIGLAAAVVVLAVVAVVLRPWRGGNGPPAAPASEAAPSRGSSIAVLPFANASGDPEQEYFSDGLTDEIINELSRIQELFVIARTSTFQYKGSSTDVRTIGDALGVRYVLEGSVRRAGESIRVTAQLSDAREGRQIWGETYDRSLTAHDLFGLQDDLKLQVVNAIAGSYGALARARLAQARRKPPASLDSYDCVLRTYEYLHVHTDANHLAARECLERTVGIDTDYADGQAWLAYLYAEEYHHRRNERPGEYKPLARALEMAEAAVRLDTANQVSHGVLSLAHFFRGDYERGKIEARRTVDLNPNNALWLALMGTYLAQQADFEQGVAMVRKAIALNPHPPRWINFPIFLEHYHHGRYEEALAEAKPLLEEMRALWPHPASEIRRDLIERHSFSPGLTDHLLEGLRKAGMSGLSPASTP